MKKLAAIMLWLTTIVLFVFAIYQTAYGFGIFIPVLGFVLFLVSGCAAIAVSIKRDIKGEHFSATFLFVLAVSSMMLSTFSSGLILTIVGWLFFAVFIVCVYAMFTVSEVNSEIEESKKRSEQIENEIKARRLKEEEYQERIRKEREEKRKHREEKREAILKNKEVGISKEEYRELFAGIINVPVDTSLPPVKRLESVPDWYVTKSVDFDCSDFVVIDIETTGLSPTSNRIIEVCSVRFRAFKPTEYMHTLVYKRGSISEKITKINGIATEMIKDAPKFEEIGQSFINFIGSEKNIVAHNIEFDLPFLYCSGANLVEEGRNYICTLAIAREFLQGEVKNNKLPTLLKYFNIYNPKSHRAVSDAIGTGFLFKGLVGGDATIKEVLHNV